MKNMYTLNIQVLNSNGEELVDKQLKYESLEELGNVTSLAYDIMNEAKTNEDNVFEVPERTDEEMVFGGSSVKEL